MDNRIKPKFKSCICYLLAMTYNYLPVWISDSSLRQITTFCWIAVSLTETTRWIYKTWYIVTYSPYEKSLFPMIWFVQQEHHPIEKHTSWTQVSKTVANISAAYSYQKDYHFTILVGFLFLDLFYVYDCLHVCMSNMCMPSAHGEGIRLPETRVTDGCGARNQTQVL